MTYRPSVFDQAFRVGMGLILVSMSVIVAKHLALLAPDAGGVIKVAVFGLLPVALGAALMTRRGFPRFLGALVAVAGLGWIAYLWSLLA